LSGLNCNTAEEAYRPEYAFPSSTQVEASGRKWSMEDCKTCIKNLVWKIPRHALKGPTLQERIRSVDMCPSIQQVELALFSSVHFAVVVSDVFFRNSSLISV
jgi:hypothetical protein